MGRLSTAYRQGDGPHPVDLRIAGLTSNGVRRRDRALSREGITVIRVTRSDLTTGRAELARDLREILTRR